MAGITSNVNSVPSAMPATITMPMELRAAAPAPVTSVSGKWPQTVATLVISTGRNRVAAACRTASILVRPVCCSSLANWTIKIPFLETSPTSVTKPTCE